MSEIHDELETLIQAIRQSGADFECAYFSIQPPEVIPSLPPTEENR